MAGLETRGFFEEIGRPMVSGFEFVGKSAMADYGDTSRPSIAGTRRSGKDTRAFVHAEPGRLLHQLKLVFFSLPESQVGLGVAVLKVSETTECLEFVSIGPPNFGGGGRH